MDIYKVYQFALKIPRFVGALSECEGSPLAHRFLKEFERLNEHFTKFTELVECVIDMDSLPDLNINPEHDPSLAELKGEMDEVKHEIETLFVRAKVCGQASFLSAVDGEESR